MASLGSGSDSSQQKVGPQRRTTAVPPTCAGHQHAAILITHGRLQVSLALCQLAVGSDKEANWNVARSAVKVLLNCSGCSLQRHGGCMWKHATS